jgi:hypothetical protein
MQEILNHPWSIGFGIGVGFILAQLAYNMFGERVFSYAAKTQGDARQAQYRRYGSYAACCARSGEHDVMSFDEFIAYEDQQRNKVGS